MPTSPPIRCGICTKSSLAIVLEKPALLGARFDHYLEVVALHCGYRIEAAQAHLEVGFERMAEPLLNAGLLDQKGFIVLREALDRGASEADTIDELFEVHRRAAADLAEASESPAPARRERSLRRAVDYIEQHYAEALSLKQVARVAGFNPSYFSELFAKREKVPFEQYLRARRLERAKELLLIGKLDVTRVAKLTGFNSSQYLRAFSVLPSASCRANFAMGARQRADESPHRNR